MCLILIAWQINPDYPLVVAANRDEFFARPATAAARWPDAPYLIAGRDLEAGGAWLGVTDAGRFAAVTNVREPGRPPGPRSRGLLAREFLTGTAAPEDFAGSLSDEAYSGFNLLVADRRTLCYRSNRGGAEGVARRLPAGIYGVSNHLLDTPWPKLATAKARFSGALERLPDESPFFELLADDGIAPDDELPATGVSLEWERLLSAVFVRSAAYGTRASTLLLVRADGSGALREQSFDASGMRGEVCLNFGREMRIPT
jgi:uncharacterized protein with NRDE domain